MSLFPPKWTFKSRKTRMLEASNAHLEQVNAQVNAEKCYLRNQLQEAKSEISKLKHFKVNMEQIKKLATDSINKSINDSMIGMMFKDIGRVTGIPSTYLYPDSFTWRLDK